MDYKKMTNEEIYEYATDVLYVLNNPHNDAEHEAIIKSIGM